MQKYFFGIFQVVLHFSSGLYQCSLPNLYKNITETLFDSLLTFQSSNTVSKTFKWLCHLLPVSLGYNCAMINMPIPVLQNGKDKRKRYSSKGDVYWFGIYYLNRCLSITRFTVRAIIISLMSIAGPGPELILLLFSEKDGNGDKNQNLQSFL